MSSYQIDPDVLFSDSDGSPTRRPTPPSHHGTNSPLATALPTKRPRPAPAPPRAPSLGKIRLTVPPGVASYNQTNPPAPRPSYTPAPTRPSNRTDAYQPPPPHNKHPANTAPSLGPIRITIPPGCAAPPPTSYHSQPPPANPSWSSARDSNDGDSAYAGHNSMPHYALPQYGNTQRPPYGDGRSKGGYHGRGRGRGRGRGHYHYQHASHQQPDYNPNSLQEQRPPFGRGRNATLPAHMTKGANNISNVTPSDSSRGGYRGGGIGIDVGAGSGGRGGGGGSGGGKGPRVNLAGADIVEPPVIKTADDALLEVAATILPASSRERVIADSKSQSSDRKRPSSRRRNSAVRSDVANERNKRTLLQNVKQAEINRPKMMNFQLASLMAKTKRSAENGLIKMPSNSASDARRGKRRRLTEREFYAGVTMTKEMREREERERREEEERIREERRRVVEEFLRRRVLEREERKGQCAQWAKVDTVASSMRMAYRMSRWERQLFAGEDDEPKKDTLEFVGLKTKDCGVEDEMTTAITAVEIVEY